MQHCVSQTSFTCLCRSDESRVGQMNHLRSSTWVPADNLAAVGRTNNKSLSDIGLLVLDQDLMMSRPAMWIEADGLHRNELRCQ
jgi:hypothetical protein